MCLYSNDKKFNDYIMLRLARRKALVVRDDKMVKTPPGNGHLTSWFGPDQYSMLTGTMSAQPAHPAKNKKRADGTGVPSALSHSVRFQVTSIAVKLDQYQS